MRLIYITILLIGCCIGTAKSQLKSQSGDRPRRSTLSPLTVGDRVPEKIWSSIRDEYLKKKNISIDNKKLLVLDFWRRWCSSCIQAFPKMEEIQNKFKDDIQILLVTEDKDIDLKHLYKWSENLKNTKLPVITGDTVFEAFFPHTFVPFHVWIDSAGYVVAVTNGEGTTAGNVGQYLKSGIIKLAVRKDEMDITMMNSSVIRQMIYRKDQLDQMEHYMILTRRNLLTIQSTWIPVFDTIAGQLREGKRNQNRTAVDLFRDVYKMFKIDKVVIQTKDGNSADAYFPPADADKLESWRDSNLYCIEYNYPKYILNRTDKEKLEWESSALKQYLEASFGITSWTENRAEDCLVIYQTKIADKLKSKGGTSFMERRSGNKLVINNEDISIIPALFKKVSRKHLADELPIINEIAYKGPFDIDVYEKDNIEEYNKELLKYGIALKIEKRKIPCLILKER